MKKYVLLLCAMLCLVASTAISQEPLSFRNRALGGIVNDDLDLVYDPIELRFVDSLRLYTNLSNLTSTQEQVFNNVSDNEFLFGISRKNPLLENLWSSVLARVQKSKTPNGVFIDRDLNGIADDFGTGELQNEYMAYLDLNGDGLYDLRRSISQRKSSLIQTDGNAFVINNSMVFDTWTLGLKFVFGSQSVEGNTASAPLGTTRNMLVGSTYGDPSFTRSVEEFLIDSNFTSLRWSQKGDFTTKQDNPLFRIAAGAMVPSGNFEFRGDVQYYPVKSTMETNDAYTGGFQYFNRNIVGFQRMYSETAANTGTTSTDGKAFGIGGSARYTFDKQPHRRNDGFVAAGISAVFESYDYSNTATGSLSGQETVFDGTGGFIDFTRLVNSATSSSDKGDGKNNAIQLAGRLNVPLADGVMFGLGVFYTFANLERNTAYASDFMRLTNYTLTDTLQNSFDTVRTETSGLTADRTFKVKGRILSVPVGIEYYFTENRCWAIRFGSIFQYYTSTTDDVQQITGSKPFTVKTVLGNGVSSVSVQNNIYTSRSEHSVEAQSRTVFTYGIGYFPTNNLQIDVLGFFDVNNRVTLLEFLKSLRLSFVVKM